MRARLANDSAYVDGVPVSGGDVGEGGARGTRTSVSKKSFAGGDGSCFAGGERPDTGRTNGEASGDEPGGRKSLSDSSPWLDESGDGGESGDEASVFDRSRTCDLPAGAGDDGGDSQRSMVAPAPFAEVGESSQRSTTSGSGAVPVGSGTAIARSRAIVGGAVFGRCANIDRNRTAAIGRRAASAECQEGRADTELVRAMVAIASWRGRRGGEGGDAGGHGAGGGLAGWWWQAAWREAQLRACGAATGSCVGHSVCGCVHLAGTVA